MLSPYRVVDLTDHRGAMAGYILAGLGAEVIAVEAPGAADGPPWRRAYNRGKRSVTTDAVDVPALVAGADVVIESGAVPVDLAAWRAANPGLVTVSITPFGPSGPKQHWSATDLVILAAGGPLVMSGDDDRPPVRIAVPQAWLHAAGDAACGALVALAERASSGLGQHVDVSAQVSIAQATQSYILSKSFNGTQINRFAGGFRLGDLRLPFVFPATDGHVAITFLFGSAIGPFTARLMSWLHEAGYCDEATRDRDWIGFGGELIGGNVTPDEWDAVLESVRAFTSVRTKDELLAGALERHLLIAPVATVMDVMDSEQFAARGYWEPVDVEGHCVRLPGRFAVLSGTPLPPLGAAPAVGQHNGSISLRPAAPGAAASAASGAAAAERRPPLEGVKVLDLMWVMAGPAMTRVMADFGATVVRVESSRRVETARTIQPFWNDEVGLEVSALYQNMNAGKINVSIDLSMPEGREVVADLVRWADVVTESFTPGVMAAWGLDYESIRAIKPEIIMMSSCLMGQTGPLHRFSGYGNLAAALCGFTELVGWPDRPPAGPFGAYTDYVSPRIGLATLLAALDHRRRTGEGQYIDLSQAEAAMHFLSPALLDYELTGRPPERVGNDDLEMAPHGVYPAAGDDRWIAVVCESDEQWRQLADLMGRTDLAGLATADRLARRRELDEAVASWTARHDQFEAQDRLQKLGVPAHAVQNSPECRADPQLIALGHFVATEHAEFGTVELEGPRCFLSATPGRVSAAPTLGQHLVPVLEEVLGYDFDRIAEVLGSGALE